jgi:hypothetical protein
MVAAMLAATRPSTTLPAGRSLDRIDWTSLWADAHAMSRAWASTGKGAVAILAALALAAQALLATVPTARDAPRSPGHHHHGGHHGGAHAGHTDDHRRSPAEPPAIPDHHGAFCCILGGKLGTALGPAPAAYVLPTRTAGPVALAPRAAKTFIVVTPPLRPVRARAPPLVS